MVSIFDVETSGLGKQDRVVSIAAVFYDDTLENLEFEFSSLIKPEGWFMAPPEWDANGKAKSASAVNGLTHEKLLDEGRPMLEVWNDLKPWFEQCHTIAGFNVSFDARFVGQTADILGLPTIVPKHKTQCLMLAMAEAIKEPGPKGAFKWPKLTAAFKFCYETDFIGAHDALADVKATRDIWAYARYKNWVDF